VSFQDFLFSFWKTTTPIIEEYICTLPEYLRATMSGRFDNLVGELPDGNEKDSILAALNSSTISSEAALRIMIRGRNIEQVTSLFKEELHLSVFDASALAGLLMPGR
jgi:hypothetical protein